MSQMETLQFSKKFFAILKTIAPPLITHSTHIRVWCFRRSSFSFISFPPISCLYAHHALFMCAKIGFVFGPKKAQNTMHLRKLTFSVCSVHMQRVNERMRHNKQQTKMWSQLSPRVCYGVNFCEKKWVGQDLKKENAKKC